MAPPQTNQPDAHAARCKIGCPRCSANPDDPEQDPALRGWRMSVAALAVFLVPMSFAIAGSILCGPSQVARLIGVGIGLAVGIAVGMVVARFLRPRRGEAA